MKSNSYRLALLLVLWGVLAGMPASAQTPQEIVIDGVNDFASANLIENDGADTQFSEIDLLELYVTNGANNLYLGYGYDKGSWSGNQIGIAIDVGTPEGGTTDPWARQIEWSAAVNKPDFIVYCNLDNNWQAGYRWDGAAWVEFVTQGPGALDWITSTTFGEFSILLSTLGVSAGSTVGVEAWVTQDNTTRGAFDFFANDGEQTSNPSFTIFAPTTPCAPSIYHNHTVLVSFDDVAPVVTGVMPTEYPIGSGLDVVFSEGLVNIIASNPDNYTLLGPDGAELTVLEAHRDDVETNIVHLVLASPLVEGADLYDLTVANVEDGWGNPIVPGNGDQACFLIKRLVFRGLFSYYLQNNSAPPDDFSVEGSLAPLTFGTLCDTGILTDTGIDDIHEYSDLFMVTGDCATGAASAILEWKFAHNCETYEPLAGNRIHTLGLAPGAVDTLEFWWNNDDPSSFLSRPVDVEFFVDMSMSGLAEGDTVSINGNVWPLSHWLPSGNTMVDDGSGNDAEAEDGIFSTVVRFEEGAAKNVLYKFLLNRDYECFGQDDRHVYLNEDVYGIVGSPEGPLTLPVAVFDRCTTTWAPVEVVFSVNLKHTEWHDITPSDVVSVRGTPNNTAPPVFDWDTPGLNILFDDGIAPDATAGDKIYTCAVVFPDSSQRFIEYKYLVNDEFECLASNRSFWIDPDSFDDQGTPQILDTVRWGSCDVSDVPLAVSDLWLHQNRPNPFNPLTTIRFSLPADGQTTLRVFDARGALVRTLVNEHLVAGPHAHVWNGRDRHGAGVSSGVYFYRLETPSGALTRSMLLLK
nr:choice-of-anchor X domain-containing protein [Candidatus Krumholzibacteria bacterium]